MLHLLSERLFAPKQDLFKTAPRAGLALLGDKDSSFFEKTDDLVSKGMLSILKVLN